MEKRYPITMMCPACIPWTPELRFDETVFRHQVGNLVKHGAKSIYIMGTSGEGYALTRETFVQVVEVFLDECRKGDGVMPMTGIISTSLPEMLERIRLARDLGCKDFQVALPCWGKLGETELFEFFRILCTAFPDCRFVNYNNGDRSKTKITVDQFVRLAREFPNLAGAKFSSSNIYEIYGIATADTPLSFFLVDCGYTYGAVNGEVGLLNSFASIDFELSWKYFEAGRRRDLAQLQLLGNYMFELSDCLSCVEEDLIDAAFDKMIERVADPDFCNRPYPPYQGIGEADFVKIRDGMRAVVEKYRGLVKK